MIGMLEIGTAWYVRFEGGHPSHAGRVSSGNEERSFAVRCGTYKTERVRESTEVPGIQANLLGYVPNYRWLKMCVT